MTSHLTWLTESTYHTTNQEKFHPTSTRNLTIHPASSKTSQSPLTKGCPKSLEMKIPLAKRRLFIRKLSMPWAGTITDLRSQFLRHSLRTLEEGTAIETSGNLRWRRFRGDGNFKRTWRHYLCNSTHALAHHIAVLLSPPSCSRRRRETGLVLWREREYLTFISIRFCCI